MTARLRIGVAGAGLIGCRHVELIAASRDCVLAGIADPSPAARALAEANDAPCYADHRALLQHERPDGLIIASPNALHLSMALDCLAEGVPALIEKPVTDSVDATPSPWSWELSSGENPVYPKQDQPCYVFAGTAGSLAVPTMELWSYPGQAGWHAPLARSPVMSASFDPLVEQLRHFLAVITKREAPLVSAYAAMRTLAVVEAVSEAARRGSQVSPGDIMEQAA